MKKAIVLAMVIMALGALVGGCGTTAKNTGSNGSYYNNPTTSK